MLDCTCLKKGEPMTSERRKYPRFEIAQAIEIRFPKETGFYAEGIELSEAGIRIQTDRDLGLNARLFILIQTGDGPDDTFYFDGVVLRIIFKGKNSLYAVGITDISTEDKEKLKAFIGTLKRN
jgi:hypothetical protein